MLRRCRARTSIRTSTTANSVVGVRSTCASHFCALTEWRTDIQAEQFATEKDLEYGFARQAQLDRLNKRKKMVIVLLLCKAKSRSD